MIVGATAYERKGDLRDKTRKLTLTAETDAEAEWLAAIYRAFRLGEPLPSDLPEENDHADDPV